MWRNLIRYGIVNISNVSTYSNGNINYFLRKKNIFLLQVRLISIRIQCSFSVLSPAFYRLSGVFKHRNVIFQVLTGSLRKLWISESHCSEYIWRWLEISSLSFDRTVHPSNVIRVIRAQRSKDKYRNALSRQGLEAQRWNSEWLANHLVKLVLLKYSRRVEKRA